MKIHIIAVGQPKLDYAKLGWQEYWQRLSHYHQLSVTHVSDRHNDAAHLLEAAGKSFKIVLTIPGQQLSSPELAKFLEKQAQVSRQLSFIIGGPEGLPIEVIKASDYQWSLSNLTFTHDLAMLLTLEALYRASTINAGLPYHK